MVNIMIFLLTCCFSSRVAVAASASNAPATCDDAMNTHEIDITQMLQRNISVDKFSSSQLLQAKQDEQGAELSANANIVMGTGAGESLNNNKAYNNIFIGNNAGSNVTDADESVLIGTDSGRSLTSGQKNTMVGTRAGQSQSTGDDGTFVGYQAGMANTAWDSTFIGAKAGMSNTYGLDNVFVGEEAGYSNNGGDDNVFIGEDAGYNNVDSDDNVAVGEMAMRSNVEGAANVAVGAEAGYDNKGNNNVAVGAFAGKDIGTGQGNTMVGAHAGTNTEYACCNTFIGYQTGWDNDRINSGAAQGNTYLGFGAGLTNRYGANNVILGAFSDSSTIDTSDSALEESLNTATYWSGPTVAHSGGDNNIASVTAVGSSVVIKGDYGVSVGHLSTVTKTSGIAVGSEASVTAEGSIAIGRYSSVSVTNSIAIGKNASVTTANSMALGGVGDDRVSVGIGTSSPNSKASLELADTDKGFLPNRMTTTERNSLNFSMAEAGMMVYDVDEEKLYTWNGAMGVWSSAQQSTGVFLNGQTLGITETVCDTFLAGYSCNNALEDVGRLTAAETGSDSDCLTACKAAGYTCCRLNDDHNPSRCHGSNEGFSEVTSQNHRSAMVCQTGIIKSVDLSSLAITNMALNGQTLELTEGGVTHQVDMSSLGTTQASLAQVDIHGLVKQLQTQIAEFQTKNEELERRLQKMDELERRLQKMER